MTKKTLLVNFSLTALSIVLSIVFFIFFHQARADSDSVTFTARISVCGNEEKEYGEECDNDDLGGASCELLGFSGGNLECSGSCEYETDDCTASSDVSTNQTFTSSSDGYYLLETTAENNSAEITLPSSFYSTDLRAYMHSRDKEITELTRPAPSEKNFIGKTYDFIFIDPDGSIVSTILKPATMILTYSSSDVDGITESSLAPYHSANGETSWQPIADYTLDTTYKTITFSTYNFSSFAVFGSPQQSSTPTPTPAPGGGGGGGGGGIISLPVTAQAVFRGFAYPQSDITLLKDAQVAATTRADADAKFEIYLSNLSTGTYNFGIWAEDANGTRSIIHTFNISVTLGTTNVISGIFLPPSISIDKSEVKRGEVLNIMGYSAPQAEIAILINSDDEILKKVSSQSDGAWLYKFDTMEVDYGDHLTKSRSAKDNNISTFSKALAFKVGDKTVFAESEKEALKGDLNSDKKVNLIDFSIMAYWYNRSSPPAKTDLNNDGKINLIDFSIMAYYWTG